jgi:translation initiation factor IF-2
MRATKAYIASLGTTGVLLAASLLMLAVVSAVVAFDRWPGAGVTTRVPTLVLTDRPAAIRVGAHSLAPAVTPAARRAATGVAAPRRAATVAPTVGVRPLTGTTRPAAPAAPAAPAPAAPALPKAPPVPSPQDIPQLISNPGTTASQVADAGQSVTDAAGVSVGRVSPELGGAVAGAGQAVAQTVKQLPLPG